MLLIFILFPSDLFANVYQSNFARGIYSLEFNEGGSKCQYDTNDAGVLVGKCTLSFMNHGKQPLAFQVSLDQKFDNEDFNVTEMIDLNGRQFEIDPREQKTFEVMFRQSLESKGYQAANGTVDLFDVKIIGEERTREL